MRMPLSLSALVAFAMVACSAPQPESATGFITSNAPAPASASIDDNGLARDDYGRPFSYALLGKTLPPIQGVSHAGEPIDLSRLDQWTVIDVWGLWCSDCMADSAHVAELAARAAEHDLDFLSIHVPASASRATPEDMFGKYSSVETYFERSGFEYPTLIDTDASIRDALQIAWTPTYMLVAPDGIVRGFRTELAVAGDTPVDDFLQDIAEVRAAEAARIDALRSQSDIGPYGALGLAGMTLFKADALRNAFPDNVVVSDTADTPQGPVSVFRVLPPPSAGDTSPLFTIWPDWTRGHVISVVTQSAEVSGPEGAVIGKTRLSEMADKIDEETCRQTRFDGEEILACTLLRGPESFKLGFGPSPESRGESVLAMMTYEPPVPAQ